MESWWWSVCVLFGHLVIGSTALKSSDFTMQEEYDYRMAYVNFTYTKNGSFHTERGEIGKYGTGLIDGAYGVVVHIVNNNGSSHDGCSNWENEAPTTRPWVALVRRGGCNFDVKVENGYYNNASAVVVYDDTDGELRTMKLDSPHKDSIVSIFITKAKGEMIAALVNNGTEILIYITQGTHYVSRYTHLNKSSVLFVSISFIVLMVISLAWLIFYYVQRFRYIHAKDRLAKRLGNAAKKALAKIPVRNIKAGDREIQGEGECCAVCIEPYHSADLIRTLPCKHTFHKSCVDPWLLDQRTCPMCKMDILKHYGLFHYPSTDDDMVQYEAEEFSNTHSLRTVPIVQIHTTQVHQSETQPSTTEGATGGTAEHSDTASVKEIKINVGEESKESES